jgi:hypothetical protein
MTTKGETAVAAARSMVGRPYVYGASSDDTSSFDCSSLVQWAWGLARVELPRASVDQLQALPPSPIDDLRPGDLVFYDNAVNGLRCRGVNHVVIWMGDGNVVEASSLAGGVRVIALAAKGRPLGVRRPGAAGVVPAWQYDVSRAIGLAGPWILERSGRVVTDGGAPALGGIDGRAAAMAATPSGRGYWVAAADGRVVPFGDAVFYGDGPPAAAMAATPTGQGYWLVDAAGRVSAFGDAPHLGDCDGDTPVMAMAAATPTGHGYWLVDAAGRVSAFGDAPHHGQPAPGDVPVVAIAATPSGQGYWVADAAGRVSAFGDAGLGGRCTTDEPVVAMADGCRLLDAAGRVVVVELEGAAT